MPDRDESTPAPIPRIDPATWEEREGFRETLLLYFTEEKTNRTLRDFGALLLDLAIEGSHSWPDRPEGTTRSELLAALADLRHLEGYLSSVGREHVLSSLSAEDTALSQFAERQARELATIANRIENELGPPAG
jgi:hypothetical protein